MKTWILENKTRAIAILLIVAMAVGAFLWKGPAIQADPAEQGADTVYSEDGIYAEDAGNVQKESKEKKKGTKDGKTEKDTQSGEKTSKDSKEKEASKKDSKKESKKDTKEKSKKDSSKKSSSKKNGSSKKKSTKKSGKKSGSNGKSSSKQKTQIQNKCTISISCKTILNNMDKCDSGVKKQVPSSGWILQTTTVTFEDGESVFDVLKRVCRQKGIQLEYSTSSKYNSVYVEGIHNIYEFDVGDGSGWMYKVNGWFPNYGCSSYTLKNGDNICWVYTCNLGGDVGGANATK